jgi:hypothetical protein
LIFCDIDIGLIFDLCWCDVAAKFILGWFIGGVVTMICWHYVGTMLFYFGFMFLLIRCDVKLALMFC